jgi:hypothetical protein
LSLQIGSQSLKNPYQTAFPIGGFRFMAMNQQESIDLVRQILSARDDDELTQIISLNLGRVDGTFFGVLNASVKQLEREGKPNIARSLQAIGDRLLRMKTLI